MRAAGDRGRQHRVDQRVHQRHLQQPECLLSQDHDHQRNLHQGVELAQPARAHLHRSDHRGVSQVAADDQQVAEGHGQHEPERQQVQQREHHVTAHQQGLVGQRIENRAEAALEMEALGDEAVEAVGHAGDGEHHQRHGVFLILEQQDQHRHQGDAEDRDQVGQLGKAQHRDARVWGPAPVRVSPPAIIMVRRGHRTTFLGQFAARVS